MVKVVPLCIVVVVLVTAVCFMFRIAYLDRKAKLQIIARIKRRKRVIVILENDSKGDRRCVVASLSVKDLVDRALELAKEIEWYVKDGRCDEDTRVELVYLLMNTVALLRE